MQENRTIGQVGSAQTDTGTTTIWTSKQTRSVLLLSVLVALVLLVRVDPSVPVTMLAGLALALVIFLFGFFDVRLRTRS